MVRRAEGEPTFHVLYNLLAGIGPQLRHELDVEAVDEPNLFFTPLQRVRHPHGALNKSLDARRTITYLYTISGPIVILRDGYSIHY